MYTPAPAPFFTVIVTSYNRSLQLRKCIESILHQQYQNFELIVVDDCSTDETAVVISEYTDKLRFFSTAVNSGGPAVPRNIGMRQAKGQWLCFCDSDDAFLPDHLKTYYQFIVANKLQDGIISSNAFLAHSGKVTTNAYFPKSRSGFKKVSLLSNWNASHLILSSLCICNKHSIAFREDKIYQSVEDYIFLLENMIKGKHHFVTDAPTIIYDLQSADSIRTSIKAGYRLHYYKRKLFDEYSLFKRADALPMSAIIWIDSLKYRIRLLRDRFFCKK